MFPFFKVRKIQYLPGKKIYRVKVLLFNRSNFLPVDLFSWSCQSCKSDLIRTCLPLLISDVHLRDKLWLLAILRTKFIWGSCPQFSYPVDLEGFATLIPSKISCMIDCSCLQSTPHPMVDLHLTCFTIWSSSDTVKHASFFPEP